ncbi:SIS domain-containing protein [Desulfurococcaceae archaeon AG1]|nr:SIS domain-containing protein [Desulfurococcaceae archaeon AG1]HWQ16911.1 SIS domain-containing protein [Sulfolobales archaeon]
MIGEMLVELKEDYIVSVDVKLERAYVAGAGDSYAAALAIEGKSRGRFKALDPYDGLEADLDLPLVIVSVSGRTRANIELARRHKGRVKIYVITADEESPLARLGDVVIKIPYKPRRIPGVRSFLMCLSALYSIAGEEIDSERDRPIIMPREPIFIGRRENYGIAYYAALKIFEIFGERAHYERLEQFFHAPVFGSRGRDLVILSSSDPREEFEAGFARVYRSRCKGAFCNAIWVIESIVNRMISEGWDKAYYLEDEEILRFSSNMIYP